MELATTSCFSELASLLPRPAHHLDRHRAQLDRSDDADRKLLETVAATGRRAPDQQRELQQTNEQLEQKAQQLAERNVEVEAKNQEDRAGQARSKKATELALTSKYKSEFLANMSHELRTPLNSILILGQQLGEIGPQPLRQASRIRSHHSCRRNRPAQSDQRHPRSLQDRVPELVSVEAEEIFFTSLLDIITRSFRHEAENRRLSFAVELSPDLDRSFITDLKRLQQFLKNLLSNAFNLPRRAASRSRFLRSAAAGARTMRRCATPPPSSHSRSQIAVSASRPTSSGSSSSVPAGRCIDQPEIRRHGTRAGHQPGVGHPAGRRNPAAQHAGLGQHLHPVLAL